MIKTICSCIAVIAIRTYPQEWDSFFTDIIIFMKKSMDNILSG